MKEIIHFIYSVTIDVRIYECLLILIRSSIFSCKRFVKVLTKFVNNILIGFLLIRSDPFHEITKSKPDTDVSFQIIWVRLGYCFTPYQRLRLYNGAPFSLLLRHAWDTEDVFSA